MGKNQHVVPRGSTWAVKEVGSHQDTSTHRTQRGAIETAKGIAKQEKSEVVIHRPDGRIRDKDSYGQDPCPPKDKRH